MKKAISGGIAIAVLAFVGTVTAQSITRPTSPTVADSRVLIPKPASGAVSRPALGSVSAAPPPLSAADKNAFTAAIQTAKPAGVITPPSRTAFTFKLGDLEANGGFGFATGSVAVYSASIFFNRQTGPNAGSVGHFGALDGAWMIDCAVSDLENPSAPFTVTTRSIKNGAVVAESTGSVVASNGHLVFGAYFSGGAKNGTLATATQGNIFHFQRSDPWRWHSCTLTPVQ